MIINIIATILSALGIYGFYTGNYILLTIGTIAVIIEILIGMYTGELKSLITAFIACIIGVLFTKKIFIGCAIGLCYESVIFSLFGYLMMLFSMILSKNK